MALLGLAYLADPRVNEFLEATAVSDQLYDLRLESLLGRILRGGELGGFLREVMSKSDDGLAKIAKNYYPITHLEFRNGQSFDLDGFLPWVKAPLEMILGDSYFGLALGFWCPGGDPDDARALACSTEKSWIGNDAALMFFVGHDYPRFDLGRTTPEYRMGEGQLLVRIPRVRGSRSVGFGMAYLVAEPLK